MGFNKCVHGLPLRNYRIRLYLVYYQIWFCKSFISLFKYKLKLKFNLTQTQTSLKRSDHKIGFVEGSQIVRKKICSDGLNLQRLLCHLMHQVYTYMCLLIFLKNASVRGGRSRQVVFHFEFRLQPRISMKTGFCQQWIS